MLDLGDPLVSFDTCFVRADPHEAYVTLADPFGWPAFWPDVRTFDHHVSSPAGGDTVTAGSGRTDLPVSVGDHWRVRALIGLKGVDCGSVVTDLRPRADGAGGNLWMDWVGHIDPIVGLPLQRGRFEAETEWWVRPWRDAALVSFIWRTPSVPRRAAAKMMLDLRRLGWRAMSTLKSELEGRR